MMTQQEVLTQMESDFALMPEEVRETVLFSHEGTDWTPTLLIQAVRDNTEFGQLYAKNWAQDKEDKAALLSILDALLGPGDGMTCGDPNCPNCKGEVRAFSDEEKKALGR